MYPITKSVTQYNKSELLSGRPTDSTEPVGECLEYVYVDDPKDGNESSADEDKEKPKKVNRKRISHSAGPAVAYMREYVKKLNKADSNGDLQNTLNGKYSDEESLLFFPEDIDENAPISDLEFYKNADIKLQEELLKTTQLVYINQDGKGMVPKLREPRNLYAFPKELGPQQAARWPSDIQVIDKRIKHIDYTPEEPEPFYKLSGLEKTPMVRGEERGGRLVFLYEPRSTFFVRSRVGGIKTGPEQCAVSIDRANDDNTLIFESRFESGNLAKAIQVGEYEYELWLRYDLYTSKHTQWFYFSIKNTRPNQVYRFSIVNFMKPDSLYNYGMKPLLYSEKDALQKKVGWRRTGLSVKYYKNNIKYETSKGDRPFYSLTWTTELPHKNDTVYFAHCYPYTYTDLQDYLLELANDPIKSKICKQRVLCRTLAGNLVYVLTITSPSQNPEDIKHKKAVVLTARVHPGESNASWMMKGFLDYLTGNSADSKLLRDTFIFKIVPMLNPDGVIVGNYRCSLAGRDLNRNYKTVLKDAYPSVWHTKNMIRRLLQEREIVAYCDLHGHSRRQNVFIYGCENRHNPQRRLRERIFPCMLNKNSPDKFHFDSCKFKVQKSKEGTGRIVMWNMGILNSYTMEATFCGSTLGKKKGLHFTAKDFEQMGYDFCDTLLDYCDPDTTKCANVLYDLEENLRQEIRVKLQLKGINVDNIDLDEDLSSLELESSDGGSDSSVSDGPPVHMQFQPQRTSKKKKKLKTKKERDRVREGGKDGNQTKKDGKDKTSNDDSQRKPLSGHQTSHAKQEKNDYLEALTHAYLRKGILQTQAEQAPAHLRYSGTTAKPSGLPITMEGLCPHHEQAFAAQLMAQQLQNMTGELSVDDFRSPSQSAQSDKRAMNRHIVEVSESQKRQELLQQQRKPEKSASRSQAADDKDKLSGLSSRLRAQVPSATFVNYETFKISQMNLDNPENQQDGREDLLEDAAKREAQQHKGHRTSGRKSRMGMHDSEEEEEVEPPPQRREGPDYVQDPHSHRPPRVKSAKGGGEEINSAIQSIKDLRQSLASSAANSNLSPTAGNYIKKLLKQELKQTGQDIDEITAHLQHNIDEKQKQYDDMVSDRQSVHSHGSHGNHRPDPKSSRSAPVKDKNTGKHVDSDNTAKHKHDDRLRSADKHRNSEVPLEKLKIVESIPSKPKPEKHQDVASPPVKGRKETTPKNNRITPNNNGNALAPIATSSRLVDAYHIPEGGYQYTQGNKQEGFKGSKMPAHGENSPVAGKGRGDYPDVPQYQQSSPVPMVPKTIVPKKKLQNGMVVPRSASSSSSREESSVEQKSGSGEKATDKTENPARVKSAKSTTTRQVVETIPTRISLMITQEIDDTRYSGNQFLPMTRSVRPPYNKPILQPPPKRK